MGGSNASAFELRAAGGNLKKKKNHQTTKPSLSEGVSKGSGNHRRLNTGAQSNSLQACTCSSLRRPGTTQVRSQHALLSPTAAKPGTLPGQQLHGTDLGPFLRNGPKGYSDLGRLICHCGEAAGRTPAKRCYSIPKRPRSVTSPQLPPQFVDPPRQATRQASSVFPPKTDAPPSAVWNLRTALLTQELLRDALVRS